MRFLGIVALSALTLVTSACRTADKPSGGGVVGDTGGLDAVDADGDGFTADEDCDDADASVNQGATEVCDGIDNDCDGEVDEDVTSTFYADADEDGYGDPMAPIEDCSQPAGAVSSGTDCDDADATVNPAATERCDGIDNNCDGTIDEETLGTWYADTDGDGWGDPGAPLEDCDPPSGYVDNDGDCDDTTVEVAPDLDERCDGLDNDCDGAIDEPDATDASTWYADRDGDGYGDAGSPQVACDQPSAFVSDAADCDDAAFDVNPAATEVCDSIDNDCDGAIDDADSGVNLSTGSTWYADSDGDSYGDASSPVAACVQPSGTTTDTTDCDDSAAAVNPAATEVCDSIDNDCDGAIDDADSSVDLSTGSTWYADSDGDTYGDAASPTTACSQPAATVTDATDCDDSAPGVNPGETEVCNGIDDDCDALVDDDDASVDLSTGSTWYADDDADGYGDSSSPTTACSQPSGTTTDTTDCDDTRAATNPGASETCNSIDDDCDGVTDENDAIDASTWYIDGDSDGYGDATNTRTACTQPAGTVTDATDCDDSRAATNPGASEYCNSIDDDCDGTTDESTAVDASTWYVDSDSDSYGDASNTRTACAQPSGTVTNSSDCDDGDSAVNPAATEICDSLDNDCDGVTDPDYTSTGFASTSGWQLNGDAVRNSGGFIRLTPASLNQVGSVFYSTPIPDSAFYAAFDFRTGGGSGADGLTLAILPPSSPDTSLGNAGGGMGFSTLSGYAVEFDTYYNSSVDPNGNHVAVIDGSMAASAYSTSIPTLEDNAWHLAEIYFDGGDIEVYLDGTQYVTTTVAWSYTGALLGFTAATGGASNHHDIDDVTFGCY